MPNCRNQRCGLIRPSPPSGRSFPPGRRNSGFCLCASLLKLRSAPSFGSCQTTGSQFRRHGRFRERDLLRAAQHDCDACVLKPKCCPNMLARKIARSVHEAARDKVRAIAKTEAYAVSCRERKALRAQGTTQEEIAVDLGVTQSTISVILRQHGLG